MQTTAIPPGPAEAFDLNGSEETLARLTEYFARFGDLYRVFSPTRGVYNYVINHPDDVKQVLLSNHRNYTKGEGMDRVKILLGQRHHDQRGRLLAPPAAHDAAVLPSPGDRPLQRADP